MISDPGLPGLAVATDAAAIGRQLSELLGITAGGGDRWSVEVLKHKPGRRCTLRYLRRAGGAEGDEGGSWIGKLYSRRKHARRALRKTRWIERRAFDDPRSDLRAPRALGWVRHLSLVLFEEVDGVDLRRAILGPEGDEAARQTARWLARLHAAPAGTRLRRTTLGLERRTVEKWSRQAVEALAGDASERVDEAQERLLRALSVKAVPAPVPIHRDFYASNLLWDGRALWGIDFDQLRLGDPALDVGHFLAHLDALAARRDRGDDLASRVGRAFLEAYRRASGTDLEGRERFYRAASALKLLATECRRRRPGWEERARSQLELVSAAASELEGAGRDRSRIEGAPHVARPLERHGYRVVGEPLAVHRPGRSVLPAVDRDGVPVVVKSYPEGRGERAFGSLCRAWRSSFGQLRNPPGLPRPIAFLPDARAVVLERVEGRLAESGAEGHERDLETAIGLAADLHASDVRPRLRRDGDALMRSLEEKLSRISTADPTAAARLREILLDLDGRLPPARRIGPAHGDLCVRNVLIGPDRAVLLDWDRLQWAEPARDVAYLAAWSWASSPELAVERLETDLRRVVRLYAGRRPDVDLVSRLRLHVVAGLVRAVDALVEWGVAGPRELERVVAAAERPLEVDG